jgi:hypothetical protein
VADEERRKENGESLQIRIRGSLADRPAGHHRHHHRRHRRRSPSGGKLSGRLRVRGNPNRTPTPFMRGHLGRLGQAGLAGPFQACRPTQAEDSGPQAAHLLRFQKSVGPPEFSKSPEKPLNFNLALRLLSFIYSDLLVLYIYDLDLELFCNFML